MFLSFQNNGVLSYCAWKKKMLAAAPIQAEMMGLIWISENGEEGHFEKNCHGEGLRKSFSLLLLCRVAEYPIKGPIRESREKHKLWTLFTCQNTSAYCLWDVLEPQDIPTWLEDETWGFQVILAVILLQQELEAQRAGHCILLGGWLNWTPTTAFYSLSNWWHFIFVFLLFVLSGIKVIKH